MTLTHTNLCSTLLSDFDQEMQSTRKLLACVPLEANRSYQPHPKSMTLDRLASHVAEIPGWIHLVLTTTELALPPEIKPQIAATLPVLTGMFESGAKNARPAIDAVKDADLDIVWNLKIGDKVAYSGPRGKVVRECLDHLIHHRAQLGVYLRLLDVKIPGMYGPSADEPSM